jgi:hypothetical protein
MTAVKTEFPTKTECLIEDGVLPDVNDMTSLLLFLVTIKNVPFNSCLAEKGSSVTSTAEVSPDAQAVKFTVCNEIRSLFVAIAPLPLILPYVDEEPQS